MKKTTRIICIALVLTMIIATLTACNVTIDSMTIKSLGNVKNEYVKDSVIDTTGLTVEVTYNDGSTKVVSESDLTITKPSTATAGNVKLKIAYEGKEIEVGIAIVDTIDGTYTITEFSAPAFVSLYKSNTKSSSPTGKEYFKKNTDGYKVGAQNEFKFLPIIKALDENKKPISVTAYKSVSKIFLDDAELTGDMLAKYVVIDNNLSTYKFTNDAVGKTFKLSVKPFYQQDMKAVEFTFEVINGWNCYNIADLSMIDNSKVGEVGTWDAIKSSKGLPTDVVATGIVMHSNIVVKDTDLPIEFFVNKNIAEGINDYQSLFTHLSQDEKQDYQIVGNYFTIDFSQVAKVGNSTTVQSHSQFFMFRNTKIEANYEVAPTFNGKYIMKNLNVIGNAPNEESEKGALGLIFYKAAYINIEATNIIDQSTYIPFFSETLTNMTVNDCKAYNSFSVFVYSYGGKNIEINDCELDTCGGPAILLQELYKKEALKPELTINNSNIKALVSGNETWFTLTGSTAAVTSIKALNQLVALTSKGLSDATSGAITSKTYLQNDKVNFIAIMLPTGESLGDVATTDTIYGRATVNNVGKDTHILDLSTPSKVDVSNICKANAMPIFESSKGQTMTTDTTQLLKIAYPFVPITSLVPSEMEYVQGLFSGDYISLYLSLASNTSYIGALLGYYNA